MWSTPPLLLSEEAFLGLRLFDTILEPNGVFVSGAWRLMELVHARAHSLSMAISHGLLDLGSNFENTKVLSCARPLHIFPGKVSHKPHISTTNKWCGSSVMV